MSRRRKLLLRGAVWSGVGLLALLLASYAVLTRPARLRALALAALQERGLRSVSIGNVSFSPFEGVQIADLHLSPTDDLPLYRSSAAPRPPLLRVSHVQIRCGLWSALCGSPAPDDVHIGGVAVTLIGDASRSQRSWEMSRGAAAMWRSDWDALLGAAQLPPVSIDSADVQFMAVDGEQLQLVERWMVRGSGRSTGDGYSLSLRRLGGPTGESGALLEAELHAGARLVSLSADWLRLQTIGEFLPASLARTLAHWQIDGQARVPRVSVRLPVGGPRADGAAPFELVSADIELSELRGSVPIEDGFDAPPDGRERSGPRFLRISHGTVRVTCGAAADASARGGVAVRAAGTLNGAPFSVDGALSARLSDTAGLLRSVSAAMGDGGVADGAEESREPLVSLRSARFEVRGIRLPEREGAAAFLDSPRLPSAVRAFFVDYSPRGLVNVRVDYASPQTDDGAAAGAQPMGRTIADFEALGGQCRYFRFPYDFDDVRGTVRLVDGRLLLRGLSGRHGDGRAALAGEIFCTDEWTGFDLVIRAAGIALDGDLYAAIPERYRALWTRAAPLGLADISARLQRETGSREVSHELVNTIEARMVAGSVQTPEGRRIHGVSADMSIDERGVRLRELHGYDGGQAVTLRGEFGVTGERLRIEAADVPIERRLPLDAGSGEGLEFAGRADVVGHEVRDGDGPRDAQYTIRIRDGSLRTLSDAPPWTGVRGVVALVGDRAEVHALSARQGLAEISASGTAPAAGGGDRPLLLDVRARAPAMESLLPQFVPAGLRSAADALGLHGQGEISVTLHPDSTGAQAADVAFWSEGLRPSIAPIALRDGRARFRIGGGAVTIEESSARRAAGGAALALSGGATYAAGREGGEFQLSVGATAVDSELLDALPRGLGGLLRRLEASGNVRILLDHVRWIGEESRRWEIAGRVPIASAKLTIGLPLAISAGEVSGICRVDERGEASIDARVVIAEGALAGRAAERWEGRLTRRAGERLVRLEDMRGRLGDGEAIASVTIDTETSDYEVSLTVEDALLHALLPKPNDAPGAPPRPGRVNGNLYLRGRGEDNASRQGGGRLHIRGTSFVRVPILNLVKEAGDAAQQAIGDDVEEIDLRFLWQGDTLRFQRVDINSRDVRLVGEGTWNLTTDQLSLTLVGAHPRALPRLALLTDLVEVAGQELVQYRVEGKSDAPTVTAEPLHRLNDAIRALIRGR